MAIAAWSIFSMFGFYSAANAVLILTKRSAASAPISKDSAATATKVRDTSMRSFRDV